MVMGKALCVSLLILLSASSLSAMDTEMDTEKKDKEIINNFDQDCLFVVFQFLPFNELIHKTSFTCKKWKKMIYLLFRSEAREARFEMKIANPIGHTKHFYELFLFLQFLKENIASPYTFECPYYEGGSRINGETKLIVSCDEHKKLIQKMSKSLKFSYKYSQEYFSKKDPCYLYSMVKHLIRLNPPQRLELFKGAPRYNVNMRNALLAEARLGICTCGERHFPEFQWETMELNYSIGDNDYSVMLVGDFVGDNNYPMIFDSGHIDINSEEDKQQLLKNILQPLQSDIDDQTMAEIHENINELREKLTLRYGSIWGQPDKYRPLIIVLAIGLFFVGITIAL